MRIFEYAGVKAAEHVRWISFGVRGSDGGLERGGKIMAVQGICGLRQAGPVET